jgi:transcriptional regulator with XRE-family HTH domain
MLIRMGRVIRLLREIKGIKANDLVKTCNISNATLCRYEKGISDISVEHLIAISRALGLGDDLCKLSYDHNMELYKLLTEYFKLEEQLLREMQSAK